MMSPQWFVKMFMANKCDLHKMYYGLHKNYTIAQLVNMHALIKRSCPKLPDFILKGGIETLPEEYKKEINELQRPGKTQIQNFVKRFELNRQKTNFLTRSKKPTSGRKLCPYEGNEKITSLVDIEIKHIIVPTNEWVKIKPFLINEDGSYVEEISFVEPYKIGTNECHIWLNVPEGQNLLDAFLDENIPFTEIED